MMAKPQAQETFFDETNEAELGDKHKSRPRRSSLRKTLSLITDSKRTSTDASSAPLQPSSPRHRRSFSFHRRASASATSVAEYTQTPSQYYNDPEARLKLKMVMASPESFDQVLEYGFPSTSIMEAIGGSNEQITPDSRGFRPSVESSKQARHPRETMKDTSFFDSSSIDNDSQDELDHKARHNSQRRRGYRNGLGAGRSESSEFSANLGMESEDNDSLSDLDSPLTPQSKDGASLGNTMIRQEHHSSPAQQHWQHHRRMLSDASWTETQAYDGVKWANTPREMTLRMTLTRPDLRAPPVVRAAWDRQPHEIHGSGLRDPLALEALPPMKDHSALVKVSERKEVQGSQASPGKMKGLWRKVKERKA